MDRMTKLVAGRLRAQPSPGPHPEPELLSAFAENALSAAERGPLLHHLAVCSDCREILFLASPDSPEMQKVLVPQPRPFTFRRWVFGWGALVASVAIAAVFFASNRFTAHRLEQKSESARMAAPAPAATDGLTATNASAAANEPGPTNQGETQNETKLAAAKTRQEVDEFYAARAAAHADSAKSKLAVDLEKTESRPEPEAKHMTAKPQANLNFDESGQVRVSPAPVAQSADQIAAIPRVGSRLEDLPQRGRNVGDPTASAGAVASPAPSAGAIGGMVAGKNAVGHADSRPDLAKKSTAGSNLGGTVLDSSGAAVANAKVTVVGPSGEKSAISDPAGRFSFDPLPPGSYTLKAEASGFKATEIRQVALLDDQPAALNVRLEVGAASEVVEVTGAATAVAETRTASMDAAGASSGYLAQAQTAQELGVTGNAATGSRRRDSAAGSLNGTPPLRWTLSPEGAVQRSRDSGKNWQRVSVGTGITFHALSAVGASLWAGGKAGALYHSTDAGQTWAKVEPAAGGRKLDQDIVRVDFSDSRNGTVNTTNGEVWTTADAGKTWLLK